MADRKFTERDISIIREWYALNQASRAEEKFIPLFENKVKEIFRVEYVVPVANAMGGLQLALQALDVGPGDEVVVDPIVVFGGLSALYVNAIPVFADIDKETFLMDPASVEKNITDRTKAIICTHLLGNMCDMSELMRISRKYDVPIVEDCAQAIGATQDNKYAGTFGAAGVFSFNHRKQVSLGQGGFMIVNDGEIYKKIHSVFQFGRIPSRLAWNFAMPSIVAAAATVQLEYLDDYVSQDMKLASFYTEAVRDARFLVPQKIHSNTKHAYHIWAALFEGDRYGLSVEKFRGICKDEGVEYFLFGFVPYGFEGLPPSPVYKYAVFREPRADKHGCPYSCRYYEGRKTMDDCPNAEYVAPRLFNSVLSPLRGEYVREQASRLSRAVARALK